MMEMFFHYTMLKTFSGYAYDGKENIFMLDEQKIEEGVRLLLEGIGEDVNREGLKETPGRVARMCREIYGGMWQDAGVHLAKQFEADNNELVLEKDITFYSMCEHHLLPFYGKAHIAYIPNGKVAGLSKLARTVEVYARRAQIQEKLTAQIADALWEHLNPQGVMVIVEAEHMCMTMRGVKKPGSKTMSYATRGSIKEDPQMQRMILEMVKE
jgi:GTP cyclohydrolase I